MWGGQEPMQGAAARLVASLARPAARPLSALGRWTEPVRVVVPPPARPAVPPPVPAQIPETLKMMGFPTGPVKPMPLPSPPQRRILGDWTESVFSAFEALNRNARKPKKANHGKRPCSSVQRKYKRKTQGKRK